MGIANLFKKKVPAPELFPELKGLVPFGGARGIPNDYECGPLPILQGIVFPCILFTDIWEKQRFNKAVRDLAKTLGGKHFTVCPVSELREVCMIDHKKVEVAHDKLRSIHCVDYVDISQEVLRDIRNQINIVLAGPSSHPNLNMVQEPLKQLS